MITALIVDDEKTSREALKGMLERYCPEVQIIGEANGYKSALYSISKITPTVVFLDIQMPDGSGFKLLEDLIDINFEVIFVTAFDQFAIKAIKFSALDYLLKPVSPEDIQAAVKKLKQQQLLHNNTKNVRVLLNTLQHSAENPEKLVLKSSNQVMVVDVSQIIRLESDDCYTTFHFSDGSSFMVSRTLKEFEELLNEEQFIRVHKSHMVNIQYINKYYKQSEASYLELKDNSQVPVSRRKREKLNEMLSHL